jgi:hypothetical protein
MSDKRRLTLKQQVVFLGRVRGVGAQMRSVSVTLELLVPGHTANTVLDFLLDTFVSGIMPHHLPERHDCGGPGYPTAPTV